MTSMNTPYYNAIASEKLTGLALWNLYFFIKFYLYNKGSINFHGLENFAFALVLVLPVAKPFLKTLRQIIAIPVGIALFYYDSWLPGFDKISKKMLDISHFDPQYFIELGSRLMTAELLASLVIMSLAYRYLKNHIRLTLITSIILGVILVQQKFTDNQPSFNVQTDHAPNSPLASSPQEQLENFYQSEATRFIDYSQTSLTTEFDVLIINVCSLSWDDLKYTGLDKHPLFSKFDLLFTQFNSATSYSGPAAVRLLKASCGQNKHQDLYNSSPAQCYLFDNLKQLGFGHKLLMNHDGLFDNFEQYVKNNGGWYGDKISPDNPVIVQRSFDGSPIYSDKDMFDTWLAHKASVPTATYYNTVSLHDGNVIVNDAGNLNSLENFHPRLTSLLNDMTALFEQIEKSQRKVMVIVVPEHGAGLTGDKLQMAGMREFPSPDITNVPVGIRFFGLDKPNGKTQQVYQPSSYLAISALLERAVAQDIYGNPNVSLSTLLQNLPTTEHVAENDGSIVLKFNQKHLLKIEDENWITY